MVIGTLMNSLERVATRPLAPFPSRS